MKYKLTILKLLFLFFLFTQVNAQNTVNVKSVPKESLRFNYDLSNPVKKWTLNDDLIEISGQVWLDKNHILAIEDLRARLYYIRLDNEAVVEKIIPFRDPGKKDKKFDVEDVTVIGKTAYALWSHGDIFKITNWQTNPVVTRYETGLSKDNNTEGICYDPVSKNLLIACKNETDEKDEKKSTRAIYEFDLKKNKLKKDPFLLIYKKDFKDIADEKLDFYPSAITVHPVTNDVYILSTRDTKCLAQFSYKGKLKSVQFIDKDMMPQPEGICFSPDGTLLISTQGRRGNPAAIYQFDVMK